MSSGKVDRSLVTKVNLFYNGQYGWTDGLIARHLGKHDREAPNPHYRSAAPMRLYLLERVHAVMEDKPELRQAIQQTLDRQQNDLKQREQLLEQVANLQPRMRTLPTSDLGKLAEMAARAREDFLM